MLDSATKRRIDTARDILVGKVPDPKSQVEQITIALIYKFMDDMDAESEELGGKRKFFTGDFARYGWAQIMSPRLGGHEMLGLYAEGISRMPENPGVPPLFRDIFKNAYLPYRDPETLKAFLKIIGEFSYDHSERLGDAFEYLLSVLGSQGDAGQFRTPRHIIDFMVEIIAPQKGEVILDPACGTAGFLISAYKHIQRTNVDANGQSTLTPDDRARLANNLKGYDISPDMVRLSLANLYLHGFTEPHVHEYDTLTSEERWGEYADVILANPPFMSPKGGIKPHKRFSIQAKRSEVLFVDYMAEHLTASGRAAIIVPDGILFQKGTAYKQLRKLLVEQSLVAVVSLPAGCFNPYSGVKTSILILDKATARHSSTIGFYKIDNDGFGLGAQRREIVENDLPAVGRDLAEFLRRLRARELLEGSTPGAGQIISKSRIAANGDYNLGAERYREGVVYTTHFPMRTVGSLVKPITAPAKIQKSDFGTKGRFPIIDQSQEAIAGWTDDEASVVHSAVPLVVFGDHTCAVKFIEGPFAQGADGIKILQASDEIDARFLYHVLRDRPITSGGYQRHYSLLKEHQIPLPPLEVQREIVQEIDGYLSVITGARAVLDNYRPLIPARPEWPVVRLEELCSFASGGTPSKANETYWNGEIPWVSAKDLKTEEIYDAVMHVSQVAVRESATKIAEVGTILVLVRGMGLANGIPIAEVMRRCAFNQDLKALIPDNSVVASRFLAHSLRQQQRRLRAALETAAHGTLKLNTDVLRSLPIPLPPIAVQRSIISEIDEEQAVVASNKKLIERFENKVRATLARVWGEESEGGSVDLYNAEHSREPLLV